MMTKPPYFEKVQAKSAQRWDQLERDPELAGPWQLLFMQVQSPRHVLSELLQNADDAGATEASVRIKDRVFIFGHNGEDFSEEHFGSLCRFGFSNKKSLHTIGFRGIGFKSTFSLGDRVEVLTPTLSVAFYRKRFTEPQWIDALKTTKSFTEVRVPISDQHRQKEVEKNLAEWLKSPTSLLFFKHIRSIRIEEHEICWKAMGPGPVPNSEWMALSDKAAQRFLLVRSAPEEFPEEALLEIKQERAFNLDDKTEFPPCQVEIVLNAKGRLFVVLPTGVETALPFACNAPFIQDPARLKIKDPEISPTNRWLLHRAGRLTAASMLQWLQRTDLAPNERCLAYAILPNVPREDNSIEGNCETIVEQAFKASLETAAYLLTDDGELKAARQSIVLPKAVFDIWTAVDAAKLLDSSGRSPLSRYVAEAELQKLVSWGVVDKIEKADVLRILQSTRPPKPETWQQLLILWSYLAAELSKYYYHNIKELVQILPVHGKDVLYAARDVVRLGEKRLLQSDKDWDFLSEHLLVLNQNWLRYLTEQRRAAEEQEQKTLGENVEAAYSVLNAIGFKEVSDVSKVCERVAADFFHQKELSLSDCIRISQIAAKLGATVGESFRFVTKDSKLRAVKETLLFDADGELESVLPALWCESHALHPDYSSSFFACTSEEWARWISSGRAGLSTFVPPSQKRKDIWGRNRIEKEVRLRGCVGNISYPFTPNNFLVEDWNFEDSHWRHWESLAKQDNTVWGSIAESILAQPETFWHKCKSARALQIATTGNTRVITYEELLPSWILKLRELPCLPDTRGNYHKPADLLRRTPETEALLDVEPFIHGRLDNETIRPLLKLLGVRDIPTGPKHLLDCLRALAKADRPPVYEVEKWYRRLDHMIYVCSTDDAKKIRQAFAEEKLILTESNRWDQAAGVFLSSNEEDVPGAEIIRPSVNDLALWRKVGVAERPTADLAIQWLKGLPSNQPLPQEETNRIRALLTRHAHLIWKECEHWLNLAGEWAPVATLEYALTMQNLVPWKHLHEWVKKKTADFQRLPVEISEAPPFSTLPALAAQIEDRFHTSPNFHGRSERKPWLNKLGAELCRISLDTVDETERIRGLAARLEETLWQTTPGLELIPYISGVPGGTPRQAEATWLDKVLYVEQRPLPKLARNVAQELGRAFRRQDIGDAIKLCFERPSEFVTEYLEENFKLEPRQKIQPLVDEPISGAEKLEVPEEKILPETEEATAPEVTEDIAEEPKAEKVLLGEVPETEKPEQRKDDGLEVAPDQGGLDKQEDVVLVPRRPVKPATPSLIECFAESLGYKKSGEERFMRADGSWIGKTNGSNRFPWEMRSTAGELIRYLWTKDHCLEREALQLEADVWGLIEKFPEMYALVLSDLQDKPVEVTGERIRNMRDKGEVILYPATYRIVYKTVE